MPLEDLKKDLGLMVRCAREEPDPIDAQYKRVEGGFESLDPFTPIYFRDAEYRRRRQALIREIVRSDDDARANNARVLEQREKARKEQEAKEEAERAKREAEEAKRAARRKSPREQAMARREQARLAREAAAGASNNNNNDNNNKIPAATAYGGSSSSITTGKVKWGR